MVAGPALLTGWDVKNSSINLLWAFFLQVFPVETGDSGADSESMARLLHLAPGHFPAHLLHLPPGLQLCPHLQQHVAACTPHLLLLRLRRPQPLQLRWVQPEWGVTGPQRHIWSRWDGDRYLCFPLWCCRFSHQLLGVQFPRQVGGRFVPSVVPLPRCAQYGRLHLLVLQLQVEGSHFSFVLCILFCSFLLTSGINFAVICQHC